jgi:hypothetical protein
MLLNLVSLIILLNCFVFLPTQKRWKLKQTSTQGALPQPQLKSMSRTTQKPGEAEKLYWPYYSAPPKVTVRQL